MSEAKIIEGDCRDKLATLPERWFHCCVTSPPYFGLRDYGVDGQIGLEPTPDEFVASMVDVFSGVDRVLRDDGCAWLNLGDSYCGGGRGGNPEDSAFRKQATNRGSLVARSPVPQGLKPKDLVGIPWRVAFALQSAGWYLRDAIIWRKPAPMPGSQQDRCTNAYEFIFQFTKSARYFFDLVAIKEPNKEVTLKRTQPHRSPVGKSERNGLVARPANGSPNTLRLGQLAPVDGSTPRNVWTMASQGYADAHFATFPIELPSRCIKASTSAKGCCPECGTPWERITERTKLTRERPNELTKRTGEDGTGNHCANTVAGVEARTLGWQPTCKCGREDVVPCRVLDCFHGAGTTMIACRRLGVDYTGIELNPDYIEMSKRRLAREANRGSTIKAVPSAPGQQSLFT